MDTYQRLHGTTVDSFQIGTKSQRITLTGVNSGTDTVDLLDRDSEKYAADSTIFFTVYLIARDTDTAAFEIKGCYISGVSGVSGSVTNTFVNSNSIPTPTVNFNSSGVMTISCTGLTGQNLAWTAVVDLIKI
jgi:hypothetical protein